MFKLPQSLVLLSMACNLSYALPPQTNPWLQQALQLQREIDLNAPLDSATFIGTHNSYNAKAYQNHTGRYIDPNQLLSVTAQLNAGVRSIEYDVHWTLGNAFKYDILLCHGEQSLGCSIFDRKAAEGLAELRDWLQTHPNEVVILYFENFLHGHEPQLVALLKAYLMPYIFQPALITQGPTQSCISLPGDLTKADILRQGKQLIIVTQGCDARRGETFHDYVFAGMGHVAHHEYNFFEVNFDKLDLTHCAANFSDDHLHQSLWRTWEDRTHLSNLVHKNKWIDTNAMSAVEQCGVNLPTLDMLQENDPRLTASIWSWAPSFPQDGLGNCAAYKDKIGIINASCDTTLQGFVCRNNASRELQVAPLAGQWSYGDSVCQQTFGQGWHFSMPVNAWEMARLKQGIEDTNIQQVWLNYNNLNFHWQVNG